MQILTFLIFADFHLKNVLMGNQILQNVPTNVHKILVSFAVIKTLWCWFSYPNHWSSTRGEQTIAPNWDAIDLPYLSILNSVQLWSLEGKKNDWTRRKWPVRPLQSNIMYSRQQQNLLTEATLTSYTEQEKSAGKVHSLLMSDYQVLKFTQT